MVGFKAYLELKGSEDAQMAGFSPRLGPGEQVSRDFELSEEGDQEFQHFVKVLQEQPLEPTARIVYQVPIYANQEEQSFIGKIQVYFKKNEDLMNKVKQQCFQKLRQTLEYLGRQASLSSLSQIIPCTSSQTTSPGRVPSLAPSSHICLSINRDFLYFNSEVSEYVIEFERRVQDVVGRELEASNHQTQQTVEHSQGYAKAGGAEKIEFKVWFNNQTDKEMVRPETRNDKNMIKQKLRNGLLNQAIEILNKSSPNPDISVQKIKNLEQDMRECVDKCNRELKVVESSNCRLYPLRSSFGNCLGHARMAVKSSGTASWTIFSARVDETIQEHLDVFCRQIELILLKMHTAALLDQVQVQRFGESAQSRGTRVSSQMFQTRVQPFKADIDGLQPKSEFEGRPSLSSLANVPINKIHTQQMPSSNQDDAEEVNIGSQNNRHTTFYNEESNLSTFLDLPKQRDRQVQNSASFGARQQAQYSQMSDDHVVIGLDETEMSQMQRNQEQLQDSSHSSDAQHSCDENSPSFFKSNNKKLSVIKESDNETSKMVVSDMKDVTQQSLLNPSRYQKSMNTGTMSIHDPSEQKGSREVASVAVRFPHSSTKEFLLVQPLENAQSVTMAEMTEQTDCQYNTIRQLMNRPSPIRTTSRKGGFATAQQRVTPASFASMGSAKSRGTTGGAKQQHGGAIEKDRLSDNNSNAVSVGKDIADTSRKLQELLPESIQIVGKPQTSRSGFSSSRGQQYTDRSWRGGQQAVEVEVNQNKQAQGQNIPQNIAQKITKRVSKSKPIVNKRYQKNRGGTSLSGPAKRSKRDLQREKAVSSSPTTKPKRSNHLAQFKNKRNADDQSNRKSTRSFENQDLQKVMQNGGAKSYRNLFSLNEEESLSGCPSRLLQHTERQIVHQELRISDGQRERVDKHDGIKTQQTAKSPNSSVALHVGNIFSIVGGGGKQGHNHYQKIHTQMLGTLHSKLSHDPSQQTHFDALVVPQGGSSNLADGEEMAQQHIKQIFERNNQERENHYLHQGDDQPARIETSIEDQLQRKDRQINHLQVSFAKSLNKGDSQQFLQNNEHYEQPLQYLISPTKNTFSANIEKLKQKQMNSSKKRNEEQQSPARLMQRLPDQQAMQDQSQYTTSQVRSIMQNYQSCSLSATIEVPNNQNHTRPQVHTQVNAPSSGFSSLVSGTPGRGSIKPKVPPLDPNTTPGGRSNAHAFSSNQPAREKASVATTNTKLPKPKLSSKRNQKDPISYLHFSKDKVGLTGGTSSYQLSRDKQRHDQQSDGASASNLSRAESLIHSMNKNLKRKQSEKRDEEGKARAEADAADSAVAPVASENRQQKLGPEERKNNAKGPKESEDKEISGQRKQKVHVPPIKFPQMMLDRGRDAIERPIQIAKIDLGEAESECSRSFDRLEDKRVNQNASSSGTNQQITTLQQLTNAFGLRNNGAQIRASQSPATASALQDMTQVNEQSMERPTPWYVSHLNNTGALKPTVGTVNQLGTKNNSLATYQSLMTQSAPAGLPYQHFDDALEKFVQILKLTTQAVEINIFSKESILIYADVEAQHLIDFTDQQKQSIADKLAAFKEEIDQRKRTQEQKLIAQEDHHRKGHSEGEDLLGYTQPAFKQSKLLKDSKYKVPQSTFFKQYKSSTQSEEFNLKQALQNWNLISHSANEKPQPSDLNGFDLVFAKIAFSVDKEEFERFQMDYEEGKKGKVQLSLARQINNDDQYLIFQCLFNQNGLKYYPEMFINICQNFLIADDQLRNEIENLLSITSKMQSGSPLLALRRAPTPPSKDLNTNRGLQSSRTQAHGMPSQPKQIINSVVYADTLEEEEDSAEKRAANDPIEEEEDAESINEEYTVQSESLEALGKQRKASSQAQQVTASASAACRGNSLKGSSLLSREQRSQYPSKVNESFVDMKLQDSPLQNSLQKPVQTTRHVPQKSSDFQNSRMRQNSKFVLMGGKSNFGRMPSALAELSTLKQRQHVRISGGYVAQMGKNHDIFDMDALQKQAIGSRMMQDKSQRTVSACTEALPNNLTQVLMDGATSQGSKVVNHMHHNSVVANHGKSSSVANKPYSYQDTSRYGSGGGRPPSERLQRRMASSIETPSKSEKQNLYAAKNAMGALNPYSTSNVGRGQKQRRPLLGRLNLNDSPPSKPVIAHAQSAKVLNFRAGFNQHKYSQSAIQSDLKKLTRQFKADGKNMEQQLAYGDNQSTTNIKSQVCFESSGVFGLSPNVKKSHINKTQNSSITSNSATIKRQSPGIRHDAESENQKFNIQVLSPNKKDRYQHGTEPVQRGHRKIGTKDASLDKKGHFMNSSFTIHQNSAQNQNRKKSDSYMSYADAKFPRKELNLSSEPEYSRSQPQPGLNISSQGVQSSERSARGSKRIRDSETKDGGSLSFSFGEINSKMKNSSQFTQALNSMSQARRVMQGSPTKHSNATTSAFLPGKQRTQKTHKSIEHRPFLN